MRLDRRSFLSVLGGATLAWPRTVEALARQLAPGGAPTDESFWGLVRSQFLIPPDRIYLNNGTLDVTNAADAVPWSLFSLSTINVDGGGTSTIRGDDARAGVGIELGERLCERARLHLIWIPTT